LKKRKTFELIEKKNQSTISLTWMFKYKYDINDFLIKFKARLCAREDLQIIERDTYVVTLIIKTLRTLIVISAVFDLEIKLYDAVNAFINNKIDEEIFIECFENFFKLEYCWKLKKAFYDLKQSSILWYRELIKILKKMKMIFVFEINCLFINERIILFFYVNDIIVLCSKFSIYQLRKFEQTLMKRFEMKTFENLKWFLNIRIIRDRENRKFWLCQDSYIEKMTIKFNLENVKKVWTFLIETSRSYERDEKIENNQQRVYAFQQSVKSFNFAAIIIRSDVTHSMTKLSQFLQDFSFNHLITVDRIISYLYEIKNLTIKYFEERFSNIFVIASDATFVDDERIRRSSNEYLFQLYENLIDWKAIKQITIITFSIEIELLILTRAVKKIIWWKRFFESIRFDFIKILIIRCDNRQIIKILNHELLKLEIKLKHVDVHRHWLRQKIQTSRISVNWVSIVEMSENEFIKNLSRQKHENFVKHLHLTNISEKITDQRALDHSAST
jgi:hypothetical protein